MMLYDQIQMLMILRFSSRYCNYEISQDDRATLGAVVATLTASTQDSTTDTDQ